VAFHELTHWTGHKARLDRDLKNRFGSRNYAAEELVAELGAAFLCAEFGFDGDVRNAGYIASWVELLKADKRAFFTACSQASKAADYLRTDNASRSLTSTRGPASASRSFIRTARWKHSAGVVLVGFGGLAGAACRQRGPRLAPFLRAMQRIGTR
jgi:antirestriction protein ArdC